MNQISRPFQIALGAAVVIGLVWFFFLRSSSDNSSSSVSSLPTTTAASTGPTAPGVKGLTTAINKAKGAKTLSEKKSAALANATGTESVTTPAKTTATTTAAKTTSTPTTSAPAATTKAKTVTPAGPAVKDPAKASGDPAQGLLDRLKSGRVVVLLFAGAGTDDHAAARAVRAAAHGYKGMIVRVTSMRNVGKYATITDKLNITVAPSTVVIGSDFVAQVLTGLVDKRVIRQYAGDAKRRAAKAK